jgi:hypothetical protein
MHSSPPPLQMIYSAICNILLIGPSTAKIQSLSNVCYAEKQYDQTAQCKIFKNYLQFTIYKQLSIAEQMPAFVIDFFKFARKKIVDF